MSKVRFFRRLTFSSDIFLHECYLFLVVIFWVHNIFWVLNECIIIIILLYIFLHNYIIGHTYMYILCRLFLCAYYKLLPTLNKQYSKKKKKNFHTGLPTSKTTSYLFIKQYPSRVQTMTSKILLRLMKWSNINPQNPVKISVSFVLLNWNLLSKEGQLSH